MPIETESNYLVFDRYVFEMKSVNIIFLLSMSHPTDRAFSCFYCTVGTYGFAAYFLHNGK